MVKAISMVITHYFSAPSSLPLQYLVSARFPNPFIFMLKRNLAKRKLFSSHQGLNPLSCTYQAKAKPFNYSRFHDDSHNFKDLLSFLRTQYINTQKRII